MNREFLHKITILGCLFFTDNLFLRDRQRIPDTGAICPDCTGAFCERGMGSRERAVGGGPSEIPECF